MAGFKVLLSGLRHAEQQLERQLAGIRTAISSLEFGGAVSPAAPARETGLRGLARKKRRMSAAARAKISAAQKKRWAKKKAAEK